MIRLMKYGITALLFFLTSASSKEIDPFDKMLSCVNYCAQHQLRCYGYIEKSVYDGTTESSPVLSKEEHMVCFQPKTHIFDSML